MEKSQLEIFAMHDFPNLSMSDLEKRKLNLNKKSYERICELKTPYIRLQKKADKFQKRMDKVIKDIGKDMHANLAMIKFMHEHYQDNTANYNVVFYRKKQ